MEPFLLVAALAAVAAWCWTPPPRLARLRSRRQRRGATALARLGADVGAAWTARRSREQEAALRASVPQVCALLAVCLDAGRPPRGALRAVAGVVEEPAASALGGVLQRIDLGVDEPQAWLALAQVPGYREVGRDLARSVRSGLGLAALLRQHAADARRNTAADRLAAARSAGVRSVVPLMLCFLPAFVLLGVVPIFGAFVGGLRLP